MAVTNCSNLTKIQAQTTILWQALRKATLNPFHVFEQKSDPSKVGDAGGMRLGLFIGQFGEYPCPLQTVKKSGTTGNC